MSLRCTVDFTETTVGKIHYVLYCLISEKTTVVSYLKVSGVVYNVLYLHSKNQTLPKRDRSVSILSYLQDKVSCSLTTYGSNLTVPLYFV